MAKHPVFPMWVQDYLSDTSHLDATEHGVYHLLLYRYWLTDGRALPDDMAFLRKIAKCRTKATVEYILAEFWQLSTGEGWHHKRARTELRVTRDRKVAARESAKKRWENKDRAHANASNPQCSPTLKKKEKEEPKGSSKKKVAERGTRLPEDWEPDTELIAWAQTNHRAVNWAAETEIFRDYWLSTPGQRGRKVDWRRTWQNWIRNETKKGRNRHDGRETRFERDSRKLQEWYEDRKAGRVDPGAFNGFLGSDAGAVWPEVD